MAGISLRVDGNPDGQKRPRVFTNKHTGRSMAWSPKSPWVDLLFIKARQMAPKTALEGPLELDMTFYMPRPKSRPHAAYCDRRPDFDNLAKGACDALTRAKWWADDSRIVRATVRKLYATAVNPPGVLIDVEEIECQ